MITQLLSKNKTEEPMEGEYYICATSICTLTKVAGEQYYNKEGDYSDYPADEGLLLFCAGRLPEKENRGFIKFISGNEVFYMAPGDFSENIAWGDLVLCDLDILAESPEYYDVTFNKLADET